MAALVSGNGANDVLGQPAEGEVGIRGTGEAAAGHTDQSGLAWIESGHLHRAALEFGEIPAVIRQVAPVYVDLIYIDLSYLIASAAVAELIRSAVLAGE